MGQLGPCCRRRCASIPCAHAGYLIFSSSLAEDLPLNVSRETLQSTRFLKQVKQVIIKHLIGIFNRLADEEPAKFERFQKSYGSVLKLGAVEDTKNREKLAALTRFRTNHKDSVSLDQVSSQALSRNTSYRCAPPIYSTWRTRSKARSR